MFPIGSNSLELSVSGTKETLTTLCAIVDAHYRNLGEDAPKAINDVFASIQYQLDHPEENDEAPTAWCISATQLCEPSEVDTDDKETLGIGRKGDVVFTKNVFGRNEDEAFDSFHETTPVHSLGNYDFDAEEIK